MATGIFNGAAQWNTQFDSARDAGLKSLAHKRFGSPNVGSSNGWEEFSGLMSRIVGIYEKQRFRLRRSFLIVLGTSTGWASPAHVDSSKAVTKRCATDRYLVLRAAIFGLTFVLPTRQDSGPHYASQGECNGMPPVAARDHPWKISSLQEHSVRLDGTYTQQRGVLGC